MRWIWMPGRAAAKSASSAALVTTPTRSPRLAAMGPAKVAVPPTTKPSGTTSLVTWPTMTKVGASGTGELSTRRDDDLAVIALAYAAGRDVRVVGQRQVDDAPLAGRH